VARALERALPSVLAWAHGRLPRGARRRLDTGDLVQEAAIGAMRRLGAGELERQARDRRPSPLDSVIESEERRRFRDALARLGEDERMLVVGRVTLELSYEQLAAATGRPTADAARVATRRAVLRIARLVGRMR
jgi:RNA polymerase sigma-70 factor (ECF subfamily)